MPWMNSYCLESPRPFKPYLAERAAHELLAAELSEGESAVPATSTLALRLATQLREKILEMDFLRYKFMVIVQISEKKCQGIHETARFLWDAERDNYATCRYETENLIAVATVFAIYYE